MVSYPVVLTPDENGFLVTSPDFPELGSWGEDESEARAMAADALDEAVFQRMKAFEDIPRPSAGDLCVSLSLQATFKLLLFWALHDAKMNRAQLAAALGWNRNSVDRLFDLRHASRLDQYDAAFAALNRRPMVSISDAA